MKMADMDKVKERVMALLAKAADPACSEDEAEAAMSMARKIMDKHGLSEAECEKATGDDFVMRSWDGRETKKGWVFHPVDRLLGGLIARFAGVRMFYSTEPMSDRKTAKFFGLESDVALAEWMRAAMITQFDRDWSNYLHIDRKNKALSRVKDARISFSMGYRDAIYERFNNWFYRAEAKGGAGALVFKKQDLITDELARRGIHLRNSNYAGPTVRDGLAAGAGYNAGKAAQLAQGVHHGRPHILLTGKM